MTITIETINGKQYTVVWHDDVQSFNGTMTATNSGYVWHVGSKCVATLLPALPRYPTPEDARLLYRYAAEGVDVYGKKHDDMFDEYVDDIHFGYGLEEITHATYNGERIEVAIEE